MPRSVECALFICALAALLGLLWACDLDQAHNGCKIQSGICSCGFGCKSEFRYSTSRECRNALKERGNNICSRMPCLNKGTCIQISQEPGFKCRCESTGFYGSRCDKACPSATNDGVFPYECVVI